jgi:glutathione S-transferase
MIKLYGIPGSRAMRSLWMLEELGVPYENIKTNFATGDTRQADYMKINPNGHIPAIQDGEVTLWESLAINLYLARKYDKGLWPKTIAGEAHTFKWSIWAMTEAEEPVVTTLLHRCTASFSRQTSATPPRRRTPRNASKRRSGFSTASWPARLTWSETTSPSLT